MEACCSSPAAICYWFHRFARSMASSKPVRNLLASSLCVVRSNVPFRHGYRLPSPTGLGTALFHCAITGPLFLIAGLMLFPLLGSAHDPSQHTVGLAVHSRRCRNRVSAGMALCAAFCVLTGEKLRFRSPPMRTMRDRCES